MESRSTKMEFQQKPDAETGAQTHPVASGDPQIAAFSASTLRKLVRSGDPQPSIRNALGALDSLLTKCHFQGDYKVFAPRLLLEDAIATRAALELIRRQSKVLDAALNRAEVELLEVRDSQARAASAPPAGDAT
jgi:hypothetical protein